jgi:hypothetical protein
MWRGVVEAVGLFADQAERGEGDGASGERANRRNESLPDSRDLDPISGKPVTTSAVPAPTVA